MTSRSGGEHRRAAIPARPATLVPALVGLVAVLVVGLVALRIGDANLREAEADRLQARTRMVTDLGRRVEANETTVFEGYPDLARAAGFRPGDPAGNAVRLNQFNRQAGGRPMLVAALVAPDGRMLASLPADRTVDTASLGPAWAEAVGGRTVVTDALRYAGLPADAVLVPLDRTAPWAVLVLVTASLEGSDQAFFAQLGSLNGEPGGLVLVDRAGTGLRAWDPTYVGRPVVSADALAALGTGEPTTWTETGPDGAERTRIGLRLDIGYALLFDQRTDDLFGDLRGTQHHRDLTLLSVLATTMAAFVLILWLRERAARRARSRRDALLRHSRDLVVVAGATGRLRFVSPAVEVLLGHTAPWTGRPLLDLVHPDDHDRVRHLLAHPDQPPVLNVRLLDAEGGYRWFDVEASDRRADPTLRGIVLTAHDVGRRRQLEEALSHDAGHDPLTGLLNRTELVARLDALLTPAGPHLALLYADLDGFKPVNDRLGHDIGDEVLRRVAERFAVAVDGDGTLYRLGGDEFCTVLPGATGDAAVAVADRLVASLAPPVAAGTGLQHVGVSVGAVVLETPGGATTADLLRVGDEAMYEAKRNGGGAVSVRHLDGGDPLPRPPDGVVGAAGTGAAASLSAGAPGADRSAGSRAAVGPDKGPDGRVEPAPGGSGRRRHPRRRLRAALPFAVATVVVLAVAAVGHSGTDGARREDESGLLAERSRLTARTAAYFSELFDPGPLAGMFSAAPLTMDGSPVDRAVLDAITRSPTFGTGSEAFLSRPDGQVLAASPTGAVMPVAPGSVEFQAAAAGRAASASLVGPDTDRRNARLFPVRRNGVVAGVVTIATTTGDGLAQRLLEQGGSLGLDGGYRAFVTADGRVWAASDPDMVGRRIATPEELAAAGDGTAHRVGADPGFIALAARVASISEPTGIYVVFGQSADSFYRDLRLGQGTRDLTLLLVVVAAVVGLALMNHRRERDLRRQERELNELLEHGHDIIAVLDERGRARFVSSAVTGLLGYRPEACLDLLVADLVHPDDRESLVLRVRQATAARSVAQPDVRLRDAAGRYRWFDIEALDLREHPGVGGILLTCHEVGERKALEEQLAHRATHDPLTGLPNRGRFAAELERLAERGGGLPFAVLFVDLDHFKPVNDAWGHAVGDEVLGQVAQRLRGVLRRPEGPGGDVVARLGGDEFGVLLVGADEGDARVVAERALTALRRPFVLDGALVQIGATIGIATSSTDVPSPEATVRRADEAMYVAKAAGRDRYSVSAPAMPPA